MSPQTKGPWKKTIRAEQRRANRDRRSQRAAVAPVLFDLTQWRASWSG